MGSMLIFLSHNNSGLSLEVSVLLSSYRQFWSWFLLHRIKNSNSILLFCTLYHLIKPLVSPLRTVCQESLGNQPCLLQVLEHVDSQGDDVSASRPLAFSDTSLLSILAIFSYSPILDAPIIRKCTTFKTTKWNGSFFFHYLPLNSLVEIYPRSIIIPWIPTIDFPPVFLWLLLLSYERRFNGKSL